MMWLHRLVEGLRAIHAFGMPDCGASRAIHERARLAQRSRDAASSAARRSSHQGHFAVER